LNTKFTETFPSHAMDLSSFLLSAGVGQARFSTTSEHTGSAYAFTSSDSQPSMCLPFYGFLGSMWQIYTYRPMGVISNDLDKLVVFNRFCKSPSLSYFLKCRLLYQIVNRFSPVLSCRPPGDRCGQCMAACGR